MSITQSVYPSPFAKLPDHWKVIIAGALLTLSGSAIYFLIPFYVGGMMEALALTPAQAGLLSGCEYYAIAVTSLLGPFWIQRFPWRKLALFGVVMAVLGNTVTMFLDSFALIVSARIFTGLLGEGILYALSFAVLGETRNPDRGFGVALAVSIVTTSIAIYFSPFLSDALGRNGMVAVLLGASIFMGLFIRWIPQGSSKVGMFTGTTRDKPRGGPRPWLAILGLGSLALWFVGPGGFWAFAERMAVGEGVTAAQIALGFSLANFIGVTGPLLASWVGSRFGRIVPAVASTLAMVVLVHMYCGELTAAGFTLYVVLYSTVWSFGTVYFFSFIAAIDTNGRLNVLTPGFQTLGLGGGPVFIGYLVDQFGYAAVDWSNALVSLLALCMFVPIAMRYAEASRAPTLPPEALVESELR